MKYISNPIIRVVTISPGLVTFKNNHHNVHHVLDDGEEPKHLHDNHDLFDAVCAGHSAAECPYQFLI